jgi:HK97 family phage major capsid protein
MPDIDIKEAVEPVMKAFDELKATNEKNLKDRDVVLEEKLAKINLELDKFEAINARLTAAEGQKKALEDLQKQADNVEAALARVGKGGALAEQKDRVNPWARAVYFAHAKGVPNLSADEQKAIDDIVAEYKSLAVQPDTAGGYLAPRELVHEIIKAEVLVSPFRPLVRVRQTAMRSVQIPTRTGTFAAQWVAEQGTKSETTGLAYGLKEIPTNELYALVDISNQMMEDSAFDMQAEISTESSEQFAVAEGLAFVSGNAVGKPEGILTNADVSETVSGAATTIADANGQANGMLTLKHAVKSAYARNATWIMNRTTLGSIRKLKDAENRYIWMPGIQNAAPNTIDGDPYVEMPDMPSEGAGLYPIVYGDFRRAYTWVDRISMEMLRDPFTQATSGNVRFIMRKRVAGQVVLAEAIRKLKCST